MYLTLNTHLQNSWGRRNRQMPSSVDLLWWIYRSWYTSSLLSLSIFPSSWMTSSALENGFLFSCSQGSQSHSPAVLRILPAKSKTSQGRSCGLQYNRPQGTLRRELELRVWIQSPRFNLHKLLRPWGKNSVYISFSGDERGDTCIILTKCRLQNTNPRAKSWEDVTNGASVEKKPS